jgi:DNA-binding MarR family transcriptional regulator
MGHAISCATSSRPLPYAPASIVTTPWTHSMPAGRPSRSPKGSCAPCGVIGDAYSVLAPHGPAGQAAYSSAVHGPLPALRGRVCRGREERAYRQHDHVPRVRPSCVAPVRARNVWRGQYGAVILGPTEDRVARYLADATSHGLVTMRTVDIADRLRLERSEAYRVLRRLQALGLYGIEDDRSGQRGGRRIWRTDGRRASVTPVGGRHRVAWARILAAMAASRARLASLMRTGSHGGALSPSTGGAGAHPRAAGFIRRAGSSAQAVAPPTAPPGGSSPRLPGGAVTFRDAMARAGLWPSIIDG